MYKGDLPRLYTPRSWPRDIESSEALRFYEAFLHSDGDQGEELVGPRDFRGADLSGMLLQWLFLWSSDFTNVSLEYADLFKAQLVGSDLNGANFFEANLHRTDFSECEAKGASFSSSHALRANFRGADLSCANMKEINLVKANLRSANLTDADLTGAILGPSENESHTLLSGATLIGCKVEGARGRVRGPVYIDSLGGPVDGEDLAAWFTRNGAPEVNVEPSY